MTVAARKQREREEMRQLILDAAREIFLEKGFQQASIRNIAEKIEYSPGTIYLYFKEKDEIFHALHEEGFGRFLTQMQPLQHVSDPFERLKAMGRVYIDFALKNKDFYDLMFIMQAPMNVEEQNCWKMGNQALSFLRQVIDDCKATGRFKGMDTNHLSFLIWSTVHGMCALHVRDRCTAYNDQDIDLSSLLDKGFQYFIDMLGKL
jgi:AcrR family transcriptional regulator